MSLSSWLYRGRYFAYVSNSCHICIGREKTNNCILLYNDYFETRPYIAGSKHQGSVTSLWSAGSLSLLHENAFNGLGGAGVRAHMVPTVLLPCSNQFYPYIHGNFYVFRFPIRKRSFFTKVRRFWLLFGTGILGKLRLIAYYYWKIPLIRRVIT